MHRCCSLPCLNKCSRLEAKNEGGSQNFDEVALQTHGMQAICLQGVGYNSPAVKEAVGRILALQTVTGVPKY